MKSTSRVIAARNQKMQSMGLSLNEGIIYSEGKAVEAVRDLAASGFGIVRTMLRNTNLNHRDSCVVETIARITREAHSLGLRVVLDCEPHMDPVGRDIGRLFPGAMATRLVRAAAPLANGRFVLHFPVPGADAGVGETPVIEAAFLKTACGEVRRLAPFSHDLRIEHEVYENGYTTNEDQYVEGRPARHRMHVRMTGEMPDAKEGKVIVYAGFRDWKQIDFWSEECRSYYRQLLECYRDIPLDGIGWDEPGQGGNWSHYLAGDAFFAAFEKQNGYSLRDRLYLLDEPGTEPEAVRVRLDYYRTLNEGLFRAQADVIGMARSYFGEDLLLGTHHTWQGEGGINDYRAGAVDYFHLSRNMDAGYTDCCWWDPDSVAYSYTLGQSLGRLSPTGFTEVNTWHFKPTNAVMQSNARLMSLMNIGWFNIWYGEMTDTCLYPCHYTWEPTVREMRRHREAQRQIGNAQPVTGIAMLHGWETVAGVNRAEIAGAHKTFCLNTARLLLERNIAFDWIDTGLLAEGRLEDGEMKTALGNYSVLVLPYASILPRAAWQRCVEFAKAGGKLLFTGTPPDQDTGGESLNEAFAGLLGSPVPSLGSYLAGIDARYDLPAHRPEKLDAYYPLDGAPGLLLSSTEGEPHGLRNAEGNVVYLSQLDPRNALVEILQEWVQPEVVCHSESILWRLYREEGRSLLVLAARKERALSGIILFEGAEFELTGGTVAMIEKTGAGFAIHGEDVAWHRRDADPDAVLPRTLPTLFPAGQPAGLFS